VKKKYEVYHISVLHSDQALRADRGWRELLGQNCISIEDHREIPNVIKGIICDRFKNQPLEQQEQKVWINLKCFKTEQLPSGKLETQMILAKAFKK